jgi:uncharacterized membrane protein
MSDIIMQAALVGFLIFAVVMLVIIFHDSQQHHRRLDRANRILDEYSRPNMSEKERRIMDALDGKEEEENNGKETKEK